VDLAYGRGVLLMVAAAVGSSVIDELLRRYLERQMNALLAASAAVAQFADHHDRRAQDP
jgi:hypothetical protein